MAYGTTLEPAQEQALRQEGAADETPSKRAKLAQELAGLPYEEQVARLAPEVDGGEELDGAAVVPGGATPKPGEPTTLQGTVRVPGLVPMDEPQGWLGRLTQNLAHKSGLEMETGNVPKSAAFYVDVRNPLDMTNPQQAGLVARLQKAHVDEVEGIAQLRNEVAAVERDLKKLFPAAKEQELRNLRGQLRTASGSRQQELQQQIEQILRPDRPAMGASSAAWTV